jgi:hypothetical protein
MTTNKEKVVEILKPCPFCGSDDLHLHEFPSYDKTVTWYHLHHGPNTTCSISMMDSDKDRLLNNWNTRPVDSAGEEVGECKHKNKQFDNNRSVWRCTDCKQDIYNVLSNPKPSEVTEEEMANMIETYFKQWNGEYFDKPTYLERQRFEACASAIFELLNQKR